VSKGPGKSGKAGRSGPSGAHKAPRRILSASPEQWARWQAAATERGLTLSAWLRLAADRQAERKTLG
jgi:hypothetical protein